MPSTSYRKWITARARALNVIERTHTGAAGPGRSKRFATKQLNQAYAILLASQFQGFCRDLHSECVDHLLTAIAASVPMLQLIQAELTRDRHLDRGNAQPGSLGADFGRLGIKFWMEVKNFDSNNAARHDRLETLNRWRNAIAHQTFDPVRLGGTTTLRITQIRQWRKNCQHLAGGFDEVMRASSTVADRVIALVKEKPR